MLNDKEKTTEPIIIDDNEWKELKKKIVEFNNQEKIDEYNKKL